VDRRLVTSGEVVTTISAGLDTSTVSVLDDQMIAAEKRTLYTWTSVPAFQQEAFAGSQRLTDESELALKNFRDFDNVISCLTDSVNSSPIEAIRLKILHMGRPQMAVANLYWIYDILRLAGEAGCGVLLTGQAGNNTVSWTPHKINLLPKNKYFPETSTRDYIRLLRLRALRTLRTSGDSLKGLKKIISPETESFPLINPEYARSSEFKTRLTSFGEKVISSHGEFAEINRESFDAWYHNSFWSGIEVRDPTMDRKLIEYLVSLPDTMFYRDRVDRRIMRLGMKDILPDEVRLNRKRGQQASDILPRTRACLEQCEYTLEHIQKSELCREIMNIGELKRVLGDIRKGNSGSQLGRECSGILLKGISSGLFLASFDSELD
jgi:asparagine synthase (glutamine-hydrolysing)